MPKFISHQWAICLKTRWRICFQCLKATQENLPIRGYSRDGVVLRLLLRQVGVHRE